MPAWIFEIGICLMMVVMAFAMFQSNSSIIRRMGSYTLMLSSAVAIWFWTKDPFAATGGFILWFALPMGHAIWMCRSMRFASIRRLEPGSLGLDEFPEMLDLDAEVRRMGFCPAHEYWLRPSPMEQGYRLYYHQERRIHCAIAIVRQGPAILSYMIFLTPGDKGNVWVTWDYPVAYGLKIPPGIMTYRCLEAGSPAELYEQHLAFLKINAVTEIDTPSTEAEGTALFQKMIDSTVDYNLRTGLLEPTRTTEGEATVNYTWRGTAFVTWQVLMEIARG